MKNLVLIFLFSFSLLANDDLYPKAEDGYKRHIINLDKKENESKFRIEMSFGKKMLVDCNLHKFMDSNLSEQNLQGYGYKYYKFDKKSDEMLSTMMACSKSKSEKFIYYPSVMKLEYNSKLPLVVYAPKDVSVEIRVFKEVKKLVR